MSKADAELVVAGNVIQIDRSGQGHCIKPNRRLNRTMTNSQMSWNLKNGFANYEQDTGSIGDTIWTKDGGWQWFPPCIENGEVREGRYELVIR